MQSSLHGHSPIGPKRRLSLLDSISVIIGIIVGVGIYETAPVVAQASGSATATIAIWCIGGALSLTGALCWAELAAMYSEEEGGEYVYLRESFGSNIAYLFAWSNLVIVRPGSIAAMAFPFAHYLHVIWSPFEGGPLSSHTSLLFAAIAVLVLSVVNMIGVRAGTRTQNVLTAVKILGVLLIITAGVLANGALPAAENLVANEKASFGLALILVLFTYGGWNEISYVAAEVERPERNLLRSLCWGTVLVTVLYVAINGIFIHTLGYGGTTESDALAADVVARVLPDKASYLVSALICISALGAIQGLIFTGARIGYAMGIDNPEFSVLARWNARFETPVVALLVQAAISILILLATGSFTSTVVYTTTVVWIFFLLTGLSVFVLRRKQPDRLRPYKTSGHPLTTLIFCLSCVYVIWSAVLYDVAGTAIAVGVLLAGFPLRRALRCHLQPS